MAFDRKQVGWWGNAEEMKEKYEGKKGWYGDCKDSIACAVRNEAPEKLSEVDVDIDTKYPFRRGEGEWWKYFYPAPEPTYRPFTVNEIIDHVGQYVIEKDVPKGSWLRINGICKPGLTWLVQLSGESVVDQERLLYGFEFADGTPCGVLDK